LEDITNKKSAEDEREEFISVVSHELRTPVAVSEAALSNIQYLVDKHVDPATITEQLTAAQSQISYLSQMINDIYTLNQARRGVGAEVRSIEMDDFVADLKNRYSDLVEKKGIKLESFTDTDLPVVYTSRTYLQEIVQNLMTNAIKYTKEGSITISATIVDDGVLLSITDTGIGISRSDQKHIFEKFFRSEDYRTRETGGTGLGLYVVSKLVKVLGFRINLESTLDKGSTFSFVLPTEKPRGFDDTNAAE